MIGSRQLERVVREAEQRGAKLVLVGDPEQLQAIEAGAAFRSVAERHGGVEIMEVRRQREDWQRDATRQLATGRTAEAIHAYEEAGHVHAAETREVARADLIDRWDRVRQAHPSETRMILTHTRDEVAELNALARDRLRQHHELGIEYAHKTSRGERLLAEGDRVMFLRNERGLGVKNGSLGIVESVSTTRMAVLMDDGRSVAFDVKDYDDIDHGYAATIHKSQGVTVDRTHVLATPGLDRHATYVALSRHRDTVDLHYGRDDFADERRLIRTLSRERAKDMASDHRVEQPAPGRARDPFAGLKLGAPSIEAQRTNSVHRSPEPVRVKQGERSSPSPLEKAVARHGLIVRDMRQRHRLGEDYTSEQRTEILASRAALDALQPHGRLDLEKAFSSDLGLIEEAANGRTVRAIRAMQLETELRTDPELRADRFVQAWQQLRARREQLGGWQHAEERDDTDRRLAGMSREVEKDPAMGSALVERAADLGIGRQWSREWSAHSIDGGVGEIADRIRARTIGLALGDMLGRDRGLGL